MNLGLQGKKAIVLSASKGIGRACAESLIKEGSHVAICSRNEKELMKTKQYLESLSTSAQVFARVCDVSNPNELKEFLEWSCTELGGVDILIHNVGGPKPGNLAEVSVDDWYHATNTMLISAVIASQFVVPLMKKQQWGRIIFITSTAQKQPLPTMILSNTMRGAIGGFAKSLANELAQDNVLVHCVMPGAINTERNQNLALEASLRRSVAIEVIEQERAQKIPMRRMGEPHEFAGFVAFLSSSVASFTTGSVVAVDGGIIQTVF
jgi:3-oxoacyl-[acyl-carrier protein] reductase